MAGEGLWGEVRGGGDVGKFVFVDGGELQRGESGWMGECGWMDVWLRAARGGDGGLCSSWLRDHYR